MPVVYTWKPIDKIKHRMEPAYWDPQFDDLEAAISSGWELTNLGTFVSSITYGQVGRREYDPSGTVRYLQVRNIARTGLDFDKSAMLREGSYNDPKRSRVQIGDILYINSGIGSLGRCICVTTDYGALNVSQDIDVIRLQGLSPAYVAAYLMSALGQRLSNRIAHGVSRMIKISFDEVKSIPIPLLPANVQEHIRQRYMQVAVLHDAATQARAMDNGPGYREKLTYAAQLFGELIAYVEEIIKAGPQAISAEPQPENQDGTSLGSRLS